MNDGIHLDLFQRESQNKFSEPPIKDSFFVGCEVKSNNSSSEFHLWLKTPENIRFKLVFESVVVLRINGISLDSQFSELTVDTGFGADTLQVEVLLFGTPELDSAQMEKSIRNGEKSLIQMKAVTGARVTLICSRYSLYTY
jgi:hypothetical protein